LIFRKIIELLPTDFKAKCIKFDFGRGSASDLAEGAYSLKCSFSAVFVKQRHQYMYRLAASFDCAALLLREGERMTERKGKGEGEGDLLLRRGKREEERGKLLPGADREWTPLCSK